MQSEVRNLVAEEFNKRRQEKPGFSLRSFAKFLNLSPASLSQILSGKRRPGSKLILRIAEALELPRERTQELLISELQSEATGASRVRHEAIAEPVPQTQLAIVS